MGFLSDLWNELFSRDKEVSIVAPSKQEILEAGACPNCWGTQMYDDKYIAFRKDKTKSNINSTENKTFIAQFVETHISGIKLLTEEDRTYCPKCNSTVNG